jgi:hypothetical protein
MQGDRNTPANFVSAKLLMMNLGMQLFCAGTRLGI